MKRIPIPTELVAIILFWTLTAVSAVALVAFLVMCAGCAQQPKMPAAMMTGPQSNIVHAFYSGAWVGLKGAGEKDPLSYIEAGCAEYLRKLTNAP